MKKISLLIVLLIALIITGCSGSDYEQYVAAVEKTEQITRGQKVIEVDIHMDFDFKDLSEEDLKRVKGMEDIQFKGYMRFDNELEQEIGDFNINLGGIGMDSVVYVDGEEIWIKMNSLGKYIAAHEIEMNDSMMQFEYSEETFEKIGQLWDTHVDEENLFVGEAILVDTPMGDVKSTRFYVDMDDEQLKIFVEEMFKVLEEDGMIQTDDYTLDMDNIIINEMSVESLIDIDNYIVEETIRFDMNFLDSDFEGLQFEVRTTLYDIEEEQNLEMPEISEDKIMTLDDFENESKELFDFNWEE